MSKVKFQLNDTKHYHKIPSNPTLQIANDINTLISYLIFKGSITKDIGKFLELKYPPRTPVFYGLPKIHKLNVLLHPIVSACDSRTENLSNFIDYIAQPFMKALPSYIKDTKYFIQTILELPPLSDNAFLVTADVVSLYTNIPHEEGIETFMVRISPNIELLPPEAPTTTHH